MAIPIHSGDSKRIMGSSVKKNFIVDTIDSGSLVYNIYMYMYMNCVDMSVVYSYILLYI